jgi:hypothetical protein
MHTIYNLRLPAQTPGTVELLTIRKQRIALQNIEGAAINAQKEAGLEVLHAELKLIAQMAAQGQTCPFED